MTTALKFLFRPAKLYPMKGQTHLGARRCILPWLSMALVFLAVSILSATLFAQSGGKAMSKNDVIGLLEAGVPTDKIREAAQQYGIAFEMNAKTESELRDAGAESDLISFLRRLARKPPVAPKPRAGGPAVLMVEVRPGGAQVYVDDEPLGTTSRAGRLKLSQLSPGAHTVRVSIAGYRDLEQSVDLEAGKTALVSGALEVASASASVNPLAGGGTRRIPAEEPRPSDPTSGASGGEPGALGVQVATQNPPGTRGVLINAVGPGSPAEAAGLRAGQSIVSVNGRAVNSADELLHLIPSYRAGQVVQIGYMDGGTFRTTSAELALRVPPPASATPSGPAISNPLSVPSPAPPRATMSAMPLVT